MRGHHTAPGGAAALAFLVLALAGCTDAEEDAAAGEDSQATSAPATAPTRAEATATSAPSAPAGPEAAWIMEATILSEPVAHEGDLLLHVDPPGEAPMALVSLDAATGAENWRGEVGISGLFVAGPPALRDGIVYTFEDTDPGSDLAVVVALDAGTGQEVGRSTQAIQAYSTPDACGESEVCLPYRLPGAPQFTSGYLRRDGEVVAVVEGRPAGTDPAPPSSEEDAGSDGDDEAGAPVVTENWDFETRQLLIEAYLGEDLVWSVSADDAELRSDPTHTGVLGRTRTVDGVYLHDFSYGAEPYGGEVTSLPLEKHELLALDAEDGSELWRRSGTSLCTPGGDGVETVLACSGDGVLTTDGTDEVSVSVTGAELSGLSVATGEVSWSHDITQDDWQALLGDLPISGDSAQTLVVVDGERVVVDVTTGELTKGAEAVVDDGFGCWWSVPWDVRESIEDGSARGTDTFWFPCSSAGEQVQVPTSDALDTFAETYGQTRVVVGPDALLAYRD